LVAGAVEVALAPDDGRLVRALTLPLATLPLAMRRTRPLLPVATATTAVGLQTALAGLFESHPVVPLLALVLALFSAGRHASGRLALAAGVAAAAALATTRAAFDPAVDAPPDVALTFVAGLLPLLVGRWARGQDLLRDELAAKAARLELERRRDAHQAAEEERMRIAADLQAAVTGTLETIARETRDVAKRLDRGTEAREALSGIAAGARQALADVRRVLGVLRKQEPESTAPPPVATRTPTTRWTLPVWALPAVLLVAGEIEHALLFGTATAALAPILLSAPLLARKKAPLAAAAGVLAGIAFQSLTLDPDAFPATSIIAVVCASYAIAAYSRHTAAIAGLVVFAAGTTLHAVLVHPDAVAPALLGGTLVPWTVGRIRRGQLELLRQSAERAAEIERNRTRDARAAVNAERMRVARELHDAVAHNLSVVAIQAAGAAGIVERDPARARQVTNLVEQVVQEALKELGRLAGDTEPEQPGLAGVDALAQRARDSGLPVELQIQGEPAPLPAGVDLAAFRIVQEALANTSKHAGNAHAQVVVRYADRAVELEIEDDGRGPNGTTPSTTDGHGLVGMRERVALYGGTLEVGRRVSGGFAVRARLPHPET
ncbi:MAG TPA: histidine kinase, partial [Solirubrobacteraceae bacterium]|nr:histidine kinase [Solirubrobacteraceae bacterium]